MFRISLKNQVVLWAGACLLLSNFAGIVFFAYTANLQAAEARRSALAAGEDKIQSAAQQVANLYTNEMNTALITTLAVKDSVSIGLDSSEPDAAKLNRAQVSALLKNVLSENPTFLGIYTDWEPNAFDNLDSESIGTDTADQDGRFVPWWARADGELQLQPGLYTYQDEAVEDYFRLPKETKNVALMEPYTDLVNNQSILMTSLISPILVNGRFLGICGVDISLSELQTRVDQSASSLYAGSAEIGIISAEGLVVAYNGKPDWAGQALEDVRPANARVVLAALNSQQALSKDDAGNILAFAAIQPGATTTPWMVVLSVPEEKLTEQANAVYARAERSLFSMIGMALVGNCVALVILWLFSRAFTRPIEKTAGFLSQVAAGDISQDMPQVLQSRKDELGDLSKSVQFVAESLRRIFSELVNSAETLGKSSSGLLSISDRTAAGANQSSAQAATVAAAAEELSVNTASVASGVAEVTSRLDLIAAATGELTSAIAEIAHNSEKARSTTLEAAEQADRVTKKMQDAGRSAQRIDKIAEMITRISAQTNMLALNATIEASRAGAAGKGFGVVATEIKELARQTTDMTSQVKNQIADIQSSTSEAAHEIEKIVTVIHKISEIVSTTAAAIEEHSVVTRDIAQNISQASESLSDANRRISETATVSQGIAQEINGVSSTSASISQESRHLQKNAEELSQLALELRTLIARYTI